MSSDSDTAGQALVVVGSSAGGIEALGTLASSLPQDFPAPVVVAQHLDPRRTSQLDEILSRRSAMPVRAVEGGETLEPGVLYVIPSSQHATVNGRQLLLQPGPERPPTGRGQPMPSVDLLLSSAAASYGEGLIAVILSGTGSDGASGARDVKAAGGTIVVQNPKTAAFAGMPESLAPSLVDVVADLDTIGPLLTQLITGPRQPEEPAESRALRLILDQLRSRSGVDFTSYKAPTIMRRLQRRMVASRARTLADYSRHLQQKPDEYDRLVSSFLIKVTTFFRDPELFEHLRERVLPELVQAARDRDGEIRLWSAGCATGEEAYSLSMLLADALGDELESFKVRVFATDLDSQSISFARRGIYPAAALAGVPTDVIERHFTRLEGRDEFEIKKRVRGLTVFGQHDLGQRAPFPRIDLALCRNVLIYFTTDLQRRALQLFAFALRDGGYLALGKAETVGPLADYFVVADSTLKLDRRQSGRRATIPLARNRNSALVPISSLRVPGALGPLDAGLHRGESRARQRVAADRLDGVVTQLPIGVVVVDRRYDILSINGAARRLLAIHSAAVGEDLIHLIHGRTSEAIRATVDQALTQPHTPPTRTIVESEPPAGDVRRLRIAAHPYNAGDGDRAAILLIDDVTDLERERESLVEESARLRAELDDATQRLRRDLDQATAQHLDESRLLAEQLHRLREINHQLLEANQDLTTANATIRSENEDLLIGHEEAQAATEEVETLNEELQATNEEQETLNEELQATVEELNTTNDDLQARSQELQEIASLLEEERSQLRAVLASIEDALLVVDAQGVPILTNPAYNRLFTAVGVPELVSQEVQTPRAARRTDASAGGAAPENDPGPANQPFHVYFTHSDAGGTQRFEARGQPVSGNGSADRYLTVVIIRAVGETDDGSPGPRGMGLERDADVL